jgi:hypothetical protein
MFASSIGALDVRAQEAGVSRLGSKAYASKAEIERWIELLGDANFAVRENATRNLAAADYPLSVLAPALNSPNAETRVRARRLLTQQRLIARERLFAELPAMAKRGEMDRFIAALMAHSDVFQRELESPILAYRDEMWDLAIRQSGQQVSEIQRLAGRGPTGKDRRIFDRCNVARDCWSTLTFANSCLLDGSQGSTVGGGSIVVVDGPIKVEKGYGFVAGSALLVDGSVSVDQLGGSFLFVIGDFEFKTLSCCVVYCTGNVKCNAGGGISESRIFAGGTVTESSPGRVWNSFIRRQDQTLAKFRRFKIEEMGIQVTPKKMRLRITSVTKDSQFDHAGLRAGDYLLAINDEGVNSAEQLTKNLRTRSVEFLPFQVRIERDGKALDLIVRYRPPK